MEGNGPLRSDKRPHVVIVGGGFGGLYAARTLHNAPLRVTLIDRTNHHVFQPLLYQVATASLSPEQITAPIRSVLRNQKNTDVIMGEVIDVDTEAQKVILRDLSVDYDYLILTTGSRHSYFKHPEWEQYAPGLKAITDANTVRRNILLAFEAAEIEPDAQKRRELMTFVIVGGGPTGVEMAGQIAEMAHVTLAADFRHLNPHTARIVLLEGSPRILNTFHESLSAASQRYLEGMGVEIRTNKMVEKIDASGVTVAGEFIPAGAVVWAAGNMASPVGKWLQTETDRVGRVKVKPDLSAPGLPNVFVLGDAMVLEQDGKPLPGVAQVPIQQGKYIAKLLMRRVAGKPDLPPFRYFDKGNMATVGRKFAIYDLDELKTPSGKRILGPIRMYGFFIWLMWIGVHVTYLIGFANRYLVLMQWAWSYLTFQRGARIITPDEAAYHADPERLLEQHGTPLLATVSSPSAARDGKTPAPEREPAVQAH